MTCKAWLYGFLAGLVAAIANAGSVALGAFAFAPDLLRRADFWEAVGGAIVFAGLKFIFAWFARSPLPQWDKLPAPQPRPPH